MNNKVKYELVSKNTTETNYQMYDIFIFKRPFLFGMIGKKKWIFYVRTWNLKDGLIIANNLL